MTSNAERDNQESHRDGHGAFRIGTHLKLNGISTAYAQMKWEAASYVNLKMLGQPMDMWNDHADQHEECEQAEQVDEGIEYVGWNSIGKGKCDRQRQSDVLGQGQNGRNTISQ